MKSSISGVAAALALIAGISFIPRVRAQDSPGSETVAKPKPPAGATDNNSGASGSDSAPIPSKLSPRATKDQQAASDANFSAETNLVSLDVQVLDNHGNPVPAIPKEDFRLLEDNVPQTIRQFSVTQAPLTVAMVIEFSGRFQAFYSGGWAQTLTASYGFVQSLRPDDYVAVIAYDLKETILSDFTNDRNKTLEALQELRIPGFSESNMFDAVTDTADRMSKIEGRKAILLISSGIDTFSRINYDQARKRLQESGVPVYSIEILQLQRSMAEGNGSLAGPQDLSFLQGDNELKTFARETGGQAFFPRFMQELPGVFQQISNDLRNQYSIAYSPNNQAKDGKFRKITVQLINPQTNEPLRMVDQRTRKPIKYTIVAKNGYVAPRAVE